MSRELQSEVERYPEVVRIAQQLIRFDTTNHGVLAADVEKQAGRYVMDMLKEVGYEPEWIEPYPGRPSIVLRIPGQDPSRPGLVLHGHLDVVPAIAEEWDFDPFAGDIVDGVLRGRGAVDMKDMIAMMICLARSMARDHWQPPRDLVVCFFADEEAAGKAGAQWIVENRPELFEGCTEAVSEVGGYNTYVAGKRVYLIQTAEKGQIWLKLRAKGRAGHGSQRNDHNAVTALARSMAAIGSHSWPIHLTPTVRQLLTSVADLTGLPFDESDPSTLESLVEALGAASRFVAPTLTTSAQPTQMTAGYAINVIPSSAEGSVDVRTLPGDDALVRRQLQELMRGVSFEVVFESPSIESPIDLPIFEAMRESLQEDDPGCVVLPYMMSAGTDNKHLARLGIRGYGFVPVRLPEDFDFPGMFHAKNEQIPVSALISGEKVLASFIKRS
ncbi:MAG: M20/M25/M40 family metallo-hydrolase [Actinomycetaceae bacterium]|nr:M20/M25/M40 family metallo-hydrolase [Arcanobacterium sp.]MDD7504456.1 M20/M25/M40 family metallo-hydrolase [Actinomycetaceae bacterium]MDY6143986.1 M20/M25/M40 family metallo-hydrolase [Arcanobacterium sp.]